MLGHRAHNPTHLPMFVDKSNKMMSMHMGLGFAQP